jgi:hypothetical protein
MSKSLFTRPARWLGFDRNPLRRRSDHVEAAVRLTAVIGVVVAVVIGIVLGLQSYRQGVRAEEHQASTRHLTQAVVIQGAAPPKVAPSGGVVSPRAHVTWKAPDGTAREGYVEAEPAKRAGDTVLIWTDQRGAVTTRPQDRETTTVTSITRGVGIPLGAFAVFGGLVIGVRVVNQRQARRRWEAEWNVVEPSWRNLT